MYADPKYQYPNTDAAKEQLLKDLNVKVQAVRAKLPKLFGTLPKADLVIKRVPKNIEAGAPGGYYNNPPLDDSRPGIYWINLRDTAGDPEMDAADADLSRRHSRPSPAAVDPAARPACP